MIDLRTRGSTAILKIVPGHFHPKGVILENPPHRRFPKSLRWMLISGITLIPVLYEMRTSAVQSRILSSYAQKMSYKLGRGPSPNIVFPKNGPFDIRAGYARIPDFEKRLGTIGYQTTEQARFSPELERAARWGFLPPYSEPTSTMLIINGMDGKPLFQAPVAGKSFSSFEEIPPLAVKSLLIIENRELNESADERTNPVVDWNRLAKSAILYAGHKLGFSVPVQGGSTLATQMEKYRHSDDGQTDSVLAKLRQMTNASLKVYQKGPDTREERRQIILEYLNSVPLAAAPGYGEIHGIGNGLSAWFGLNLQDIQGALALPGDDSTKAQAFKHVLALQCSVKAPTYFLLRNHSALKARADFYTQYLANAQVISQDFANLVKSTPLSFTHQRPKAPLPSYAENKAVDEIRSRLVSELGLPGLYELDRLHLDVESTINPDLQRSIINLFEKLHDPKFVDSEGLRGEHLLASGDPSKVTYGMMLYEKTSRGNFLRVVTDNFNAPFDINTGMKMQLGSTAKLRTLVNYLDIVASLHARLSILEHSELKQQMELAKDPITRWAAETLSQNENPSPDDFLQMALDRKYSADPGEVFFTGGGAHVFHNFDNNDNGRIVTIRQATEHSINLAYIRLMRDLVRYYEARLPYDAQTVLSDIHNPKRLILLREIADEESQYFLFNAYQSFEKRSPDEVIAALLDKKAKSDRQLAMLFYAWHHGADEAALTRWIEKYRGPIEPARATRLAQAYGNPQLNLSDYGYLLGIHPLKVWCAERLVQDPSLKWNQLWSESKDARQIASAWLFKTRNRSAQDLRLRIRFEQDAFALMSIDWKRFGFPFDKLVPSYATAIGSSGDRPEALAQLMGLLTNNGIQMPEIRITGLRFGIHTPYETAMEPSRSAGKRVMPEAVPRAILPVLAQVVKSGTAVRLAGAYKIGAQPLVVGGKTGSGDNRFDTVGRQGQITSSRPVDRTAVFVFYIENRFFGAITAFVPGKDAGEYRFTSALPVAVLRLIAPHIEALWTRPAALSSGNPALASNVTEAGPKQLVAASVAR
jgi:membrane peptidoglycan carboxypeptidase